MTTAPTFEAPHPGTKAMPRWDTGELIDAPVFTSRNMLAMIGPGLVMGASAIGGGEWLAGPAVTAKYGGALLWVATVSIIFQVIYNIEISRYTLYTGEPIFTGKFRLLPHPMFWLVVYLALDWGSVAPYLVTNAAVPLEAIILQRLPNHDANPADWWLHKWLCTGLYLLLLVPLTFGGKIYDSLKAVMSFKLVAVIGFLLFLGIFFAKPSSWVDIVTGLFKFGNVPVLKGEDLNGNGVLDPGEDFDRDGHLDVDESVWTTGSDGKPERARDPKSKKIVWKDADGDGTFDGNNVENVFIEAFRHQRFPEVDLSLIAMIAGLAAIAGNGGLTNTPISNFTRDQGWGMGDKVGAIPSVVGGHGITLSHVGCVFQVNDETLPRWKRWVRHITRDQICVWMVACLIGVSLPSILSVEFLKRGTDATDWDMAALTAGGVQRQVTNPSRGHSGLQPAAAQRDLRGSVGQVLLGGDAVLRLSRADHQPDDHDGRLCAAVGRCDVDRQPPTAQAPVRQGEVRLFHLAHRVCGVRPGDHLGHGEAGLRLQDFDDRLQLRLRLQRLAHPGREHAADAQGAASRLGTADRAGARRLLLPVAGRDVGLEAGGHRQLTGLSLTYRHPRPASRPGACRARRPGRGG